MLQKYKTKADQRVRSLKLRQPKGGKITVLAKEVERRQNLGRPLLFACVELASKFNEEFAAKEQNASPVKIKIS